MRPVRQEDILGCSIACTAFICGKSYKETRKLFRVLGDANKTGYYCRHIVEAFRRAGKEYSYRYIKKRRRYVPGTIVFIKRSKRYPCGHFLARTENGWMDPWMNSAHNPEIRQAKAGYRKRLPGRAIYEIYHTES